MMKFSVLLIAVILAGCVRPALPVPTTTWRSVEIDPALLSPNACPAWPQPVTGSEEAGVEYDFSAYAAYACERRTRLAIADQAHRIAGDIAKQNAK